MLDKEALKAQIREAFSPVEPPPPWCLRNSSEGDEPFLLEEEFRNKADWQALDPEFLDQAPGGYGTALSFFSDEAFRFFLPAYLLADLDDRLGQADPLFHLWHGLDDDSRLKRVNRLRYGERTWFDEAGHRFSMFTRAQAEAIVAYLRFKQAGEELESQRQEIEQALQNYWLERACQE